MAVYNTEVSKLERACHVKRLTAEEVEGSPEAWYIPHHIVTHNAKNRLVFDCLFEYKGQNFKVDFFVLDRIKEDAGNPATLVSVHLKGKWADA